MRNGNETIATANVFGQDRRALVEYRGEPPVFRIGLEYYGATESASWSFPVAVTRDELGAIVQAALNALGKYRAEI